ncbi:hypothetical protein [Serratia sp. D1N4]
MKELLPVLTAFLGGFFSFLVMFKTNKWNDERIKVQIEHERQKEVRKLMIDKGEVLYTLFSEWTKLIINYQLCLIRVAKGSITKNQMNEVMSSASNKGSHDKLITLLNLYFPTLTSDFEIANQYRSESVSASIEYEQNKIKASECITRVDAASEGFEKQMNLVQEKLRNEIASYIK